MRLAPGLFSSTTRSATLTLRPARIPFIRAMSDIAQFVAAAQKADPALAGAGDKEQAAIAKATSEVASIASNLKSLNDKLTPLTYLVGNSPSTADVDLYARLHPAVAGAPAGQHPEHPAVLRYFLHVQDLPAVHAAQKELPNAFPPVDVDVSSLPAPPRAAPAPKVKKEKKDKAAAGDATPAAAEGKKEKKDKAAAPAAEGAAAAAVPEGKKKEKKEKKEKAPKAAPAAAEPTGPLPSMIDLRVGKVLDVKRHPDADSLYVESIDVGEAEPRTVCSGLVKYMTEDEIRGATIIVVCNLKPVTMRGVKSFAMLLCASSKDGKDGGVEFVLPPAGAQAGDRVYFEGEKYENATPEPQLNPKKKVFETIQPNFSTLDNLEAVWTDPETKTVHRIRTKDGVCKAKSFAGASLS
ncbi:tRNA-aminoacylation cofactor arc1 [Vanrija pseudolonga]|uniref:tRNA-aminoacylation cofactor arc1 n=1 Tax=Vanrija pseudolonga TaxID=143232 RepID=A0AAF0YDR0_9TREE|nr:tRNA-aminoacylation cofactor arc1 [Vanrija pseudolonga]